MSRLFAFFAVVLVCTALAAMGCDVDGRERAPTETTSKALTPRAAAEAVRNHLQGDSRGKPRTVDCDPYESSDRMLCSIDFRGDCDVLQVARMPNGDVVVRPGQGYCIHSESGNA